MIRHSEKRNRTPEPAKSKQQKKKAKRPKLQPQKKKEEPADEHQVRVLRFDGIRISTRLSLFIREFNVEFNSIIGCYRAADYIRFIPDSVVFLYLTSKREFDYFLDMQSVVIQGRMVTITDPRLIPATARYTIPFAVGADYDIRGAPMPMGLFGFRQLPTLSTFYVIAVLEQLERRFNPMGFRLAYCEHRRMTRNFGFAIFLTRGNALQLYNQRLTVMGDQVEVKLPDATPVLIHECHRYLLNNKRCDLTDEVRSVNWLQANIGDPALPLRPVLPPALPPTLPPPSPPPREDLDIPVPSTSRRHSPIRAPSTKPKPSPVKAPNPDGKEVDPLEIYAGGLKHRLENQLVDTVNVNRNVIRHNTPPASPTLSLDTDFELEEEGEN